MPKLLQYKKQDQVAVITMDDGKANVLSPAMLSQLRDAFERAKTEARAVVLTGRAKCFSAGFDLKEMMGGPKAAFDMVMNGAELLLELYEFPKPIVMAVSGHAVAGGVLLAAVGDVRIGIHGKFSLGLNEVQNKMPVPVLAHELARDRLSNQELFAATVLSKMYDPETALEAGWLDRLTQVEGLADDAFSAARTLGTLPNRPYAISKKSLRQATIDRVRVNLSENIAQLTGSMETA